MIEMMTQVMMLFVGAILAAFVVLIAIDIAIFLRLRSSFPQQPMQSPRAQ